MSNKKSAAKRTAEGDRKRQPGRRGLSLSRGVVYATAGAIILFAAIAFAWPAAEPDSQSARSAITGAERIDVVYFHRTERCASCQWAGAMTRKTVETYFKDELATGRVTFCEVDVQQKENAALAYQYHATGSSLFLNYVKGGVDNIRQASDTYPYIGDEARFTTLLRNKIAAGLGSGG